jgi:transcription-repair coupling factor (superfamily II helicase)
MIAVRSGRDPRGAAARELSRRAGVLCRAAHQADLPDIEEFLREKVPEVKFVVAHGQMAPTELEDIMNAFYDRKYDVLLSTTIVESGLDIPSANTLIVHRADISGWRSSTSCAAVSGAPRCAPMRCSPRPPTS